ncbi:uncharacterized protein LOC143255436 isoform X3 [Tachypleus tridentatus]|uniref:uncharacterized protein LOC143255436 isoform X3 n=1 Tax=Tachypleus tridentatus TaxID=6853 RepID=UPI003FD0D1A6
MDKEIQSEAPSYPQGFFMFHHSETFLHFTDHRYRNPVSSTASQQTYHFATGEGADSNPAVSTFI